MRDLAFDGSFCDSFRTIGEYRRNDAAESGAARAALQTGQTVDDRLVLDLIGGIFSHKAGGINAWSLVHGVHFQAGIIRQYKTAALRMDRSGLDQSILLESAAVLHDICLDPGFLHGQDLRVHTCQNFSYFHHLAGIAGCKNNSVHYAFLLGGFGPRN